MKKLIYVLLSLGFLTSCASSHSGRVCGGPGGGRCVENIQKQKITDHKPTV